MIAAVVLAAGRSRRMGADTQKLLLPFDEQPLIARVVDEIQRSPVTEVVVVVGRDGDRIATALAGRRLILVRNPAGDGEMLGSVRCGLRAVPGACEAALIVPGDSPGIEAGVIAALVAARARTGSRLVVPVCEGRRGHPLLLDPQLRDEVLISFDGVGLRGLLQAHPGEVTEVPVAAPGILADLDRPEDYAAWLSRRSP
jgi:molybdenum cofactor cytidylyltransferase